jgi:flagella basal body P-ring formation protein FlgA
MFIRSPFTPLVAAAWLVRAAGAGAQVPAAIARRVTDLVAARWEVPAAHVRLVWKGVAEAGPVDSSGAGLQLLDDRGGWFTVVLPAPHGPQVERWSVRAGVAESTLVAVHDLPRNAGLESADVRDTVVVHWGRLPFRTVGHVGWVTRRAVRAGDLLIEPTVQPPPVIASGDPVEFIYQQGSVRLTLTGVAVGQAPVVGARTRVRFANGRLLTGIAIGPHRVRAITN